MKVAAQQFIPLTSKDICDKASVRKSSSQMSPQEAKLKKACQNFESIFISYMLKTMHQESEKSSLFGDGLGSDIYKEIFDEKLAEKMSESGQMKIGDILYNQYLPMVKTSDTSQDPKQLQSSAEKQISSTSAAPTQKHNPNISPEIPASRGRPQTDPQAVKSAEQVKAVSSNSNSPKVKNVTKPDSTVGIHKKAEIKKESSSILSKFGDLITQAAEKFNLEPALLKAVIQHESGGDPNAVSPDGAKGLMQLIDGTAKMLGVIDPFNPIENIMGGAKYLSQLSDKFGGDLKKIIASYNAGPGAVEKFDGVPPYRETRNYVNKVMATYDLEKQT